MPRPDPREAVEALDPRLLGICRTLSERGATAYVVGGFVRDWMRDDPTKDVDVEVFGMGLETLRELLQKLGRVDDVGRSFGVLRVRGLAADFSLPRRDSKAGRGHRGIRAEVDPDLTVAEAARRRDLTVNALYLDPLRGELQDPYGGLEDLRAGRLRAVDAGSFGEDPLRALRVMQFAARFEMRADDELLEICRQQDLSELSGERVFEEFAKWAQRGRKPSRGLDFLTRTGLLRHFPELQRLVGVPQDPQWHPEGDVWTHTQMVTDAATAFRRGDRRWDLSLMFGALCHDLGKPGTTVDDGEHIRSYSHDVEGVAPVATLLGRMRAPLWLVEAVQALTREHLVPMNFLKGGAKDRAYRRLARRLGRAGVSLELLERVARADHLGRTTEDARVGTFPAGDEFLRKAHALEVAESAPVDVVRGRDLLGRGFQPGPELGRILARCRKVQDETGWTDAKRILDRVLG